MTERRPVAVITRCPCGEDRVGFAGATPEDAGWAVEAARRVAEALCGHDVLAWWEAVERPEVMGITMTPWAV